MRGATLSTTLVSVNPEIFNIFLSKGVSKFANSVSNTANNAVTAQPSCVLGLMSIDFRRLYSQTKQQIKSSSQLETLSSLDALESDSSRSKSDSEDISATDNATPRSSHETINLIDQICVERGITPEKAVGRATDYFPIPPVLKWARLGGISIETLYYLPNYISTEEENDLVSSIYASPDVSSWTELKGRRVLSFGGQPRVAGMNQEALPSWLCKLSEQLRDDFILPLAPNHVLINEYAPGQGIMPHKDGPLYFPRVAIVSLCSGLVMHFRKNPGDAPAFSIYLEPRSLFIFQDDCFEYLYHGIDAVEQDDLAAESLLWPEADDDAERPKRIVPRQLRLSLTLRIVPKIVKPVSE